MEAHPFERVFAPRALAIFGAAGRRLGRRPRPPERRRRRVRGRRPRDRRRRGRAPAGRPVLRLARGGRGRASIWRSSRRRRGACPAIVRACAARGVGGAVLAVGASGATPPLEADETATRALLADAARGGLRLVGPNSIGIIRPGARLDATFTTGGVIPGSLGLVSQSGAICATALDWAAANRIGFSSVVSLGDALDVDFGEVLEYLALDPETKSVLLYVETVRSARAFLSGLRLAARIKPVVVVKAGRHGAGAGAPSDDAFDAALARTGAVRVPSIERMFAAARLLATHRKVSGNRLAIVTNARGPSVLAGDRAADLGVVVPPLAEETRAKLDRALPAVGSHANPVDLLGDADPARYRAAVELVPRQSERGRGARDARAARARQPSRERGGGRGGEPHEREADRRLLDGRRARPERPGALRRSRHPGGQLAGERGGGVRAARELRAEPAAAPAGAGPARPRRRAAARARARRRPRRAREGPARAHDRGAAAAPRRDRRAQSERRRAAGEGDRAVRRGRAQRRVRTGPPLRAGDRRRPRRRAGRDAPAARHRHHPDARADEPHRAGVHRGAAA